MNNNWFLTVLLSLFATLVLQNTQAQTIQADSVRYCLTPQYSGVGDFDPVSYQQGSAPKPGDKKIFSDYDGVRYFFNSKSNKALFDKNPVSYLPAFGGWCSMTLAMGRATTPKYDNFLVRNGKLYLFERTLSVNGKELWLKDFEGNEKLAEANYQKHLQSSKNPK
jgi:YHS domain-containing protein